MSRLRRDRGAETVEFAIILPVLLLLGLGLYPFLDTIRLHRELGQVADETAMFAAHVDANPSTNPDCGGLTRRRSTQQVRDFAERSAPSVLSGLQVGAITFPLAAPTVAISPAAPCAAPVNSLITVTVAVDRDPGPLADTVNALSRLVGGNGVIPDPLRITASSISYLQ